MSSHAVSLLGGALIGLAASLLLVVNGRVAGISCLFGGLFLPGNDARRQRVAFVAGLVSAGLVVSRIHPGAFSPGTATLPLVAVAGLLVGFGTRLGGGCTSGHGICGLSRFSLRSMVATITFMGVGMATVFVVRHVLGGGAP